MDKRGFYDAKTARAIAVGEKASAGGIVLEEIHALEAAIDSAVTSNQLEVEIAGTTTMTSDAVYYEAWSNPNQYNDPGHNLARERMNMIVNYFTRLGYQIKRERDGTNDAIEWVIRW